MAGRDELAALFIRFNIDDKAFKKGLKDIGLGIQGVDKKVNKTSTSLKALKRVAVAAFAGWGVREVGRAIVNTSLEVDRFHKRLNAAAGGGKSTADAMSFFRSEIDRLGLSMLDSQKGFTNLLAAARLSGVGFEDVKKVFTGVSEAAVAMQMSSDDTAGALRAVVQIMSKGKAQAEELRGQLGERLPGAFGIAAKAMNVTTAELSNMLDRGEVLAKDLLPRFGEELHKAFGKGAAENAKSFNQEIQRLKTSWASLIEQLNEAGLNKALAALTRGTAAAVQSVSNAIKEGGTAWVQELDNLEDIEIWIKANQDAIDETAKASVFNLAATRELNKLYDNLIALVGRSNQLKREEANLAKSSLDMIQDEYEFIVDGEIESSQIDKERLDRLKKIFKANQEYKLEEAKANSKAIKDKEKIAKIEKKNYEASIKQLENIEAIQEELEEVNRIHKALGGTAKVTWIESEKTLEKYTQALDDHMDKLDDSTNMLYGGIGGVEETLDDQLSEFDKFFWAIKDKLIDNADDWKDWSKHLEGFTRSLGMNLRTSLSDTFFSLIKGDLDDLSKIWESFADSLLRSVTDVIADMAISWGAKAITALLLAEGAWEIRQDNTPAVLHEGEMVIPQEQADTLRENWQSMESMNVGFDEIANTMGGFSLAEQQATTGAFLRGTGADMLYGMTKLGLSGGYYGMGWQDMLNMSPALLMSAPLTGGLSEILNISGYGSRTAGFGNKAGSILGGLFGGPAGAIAGGLLGQVAGEYIGDLLNVRDMEELRDNLENQGFARSDVQSYVDVINDITAHPALGELAAISDILGEGTLAGPGFSEIVQTFVDDLIIGLKNPTSTYGTDWATPGNPIGGTLLADANLGPDWADPSWADWVSGDDYSWLDDWADSFGGGYDYGSDPLGGYGSQGWFRHGTGPEGLPETGPYVGHEGEIVFSPEESEAIRGESGGGRRGEIVINVQIDGRTIATAVAKQAYRNSELMNAIRTISKR